jgi:hypothetical protein
MGGGSADVPNGLLVAPGQDMGVEAKGRQSVIEGEEWTETDDALLVVAELLADLRGETKEPRWERVVPGTGPEREG